MPASSKSLAKSVASSDGGKEVSSKLMLERVNTESARSLTIGELSATQLYLHGIKTPEKFVVRRPEVFKDAFIDFFTTLVELQPDAEGTKQLLRSKFNELKKMKDDVKRTEVVDVTIEKVEETEETEVKPVEVENPKETLEKMLKDYENFLKADQKQGGPRYRPTGSYNSGEPVFSAWNEENKSKVEAIQRLQEQVQPNQNGPRPAIVWEVSPASRKCEEQFEIAVNVRKIYQPCPICNEVLKDTKEHINSPKHSKNCPIEVLELYGMTVCLECGEVMSKSHLLGPKGSKNCTSWVRLWYYKGYWPNLTQVQLEMLVKFDQRKLFLEVVERYGKKELKDKLAELKLQKDLCRPNPILHKSMEQCTLEECTPVCLHDLNSIIEVQSEGVSVEEVFNLVLEERIFRKDYVACKANFNGVVEKLKTVMPFGFLVYLTRSPDKPPFPKELARNYTPQFEVPIETEDDIRLKLQEYPVEKINSTMETKERFDKCVEEFEIERKKSFMKRKAEGEPQTPESKKIIKQ